MSDTIQTVTLDATDVEHLRRAADRLLEPKLFLPDEAARDIGRLIGALLDHAEQRERDAFAEHEADDPHCTCNDCMDAYERRLAGEEEGER